jgi:hypothetical protein
MEARLWISLPDSVHNNYGIQIFHPKNPDLIARAEMLFKEYFLWNKKLCDLLSPFFQGGHDDKTWKYFEFWADNDDIDIQEVILIEAMKIAEKLEMELEIGT